MRFGVVLPTLGGDAARALDAARLAGELGFDGVFVPDHLRAGDGPTPLEPFTTLAAVAASVPRIAVGTLVARASLRPVGMLAKIAATLDELSGGRLVLGLGTGDAASAREQAALGLPTLEVDERRTHLVETIRAVRALLGGAPWCGGERVGPLAGPILPRPDRVPPVWVGGASSALAALASAEADGWNGWGLPDPTFRERALAVAAAGATPTWGGIVAVAPDEAGVADLLARRAAAGLPAPHWTGTTDAFLAWTDALDAIRVRWVIMVVAGGAAGLESFASRVLRRLKGDGAGIG